MDWDLDPGLFKGFVDEIFWKGEVWPKEQIRFWCRLVIQGSRIGIQEFLKDFVFDC